MKRLLVLGLVLGIASTASAALVLDPVFYDGAGNLVFSGTVNEDIYLLVASVGLTLSDFALGADTHPLDASGYFGPASDFGFIPMGFKGEAWGLASYSDPFPVTGELLTVGYSGWGNVTVWSYNEITGEAVEHDSFGIPLTPGDLYVAYYDDGAGHLTLAGAVNRDTHIVVAGETADVTLSNFALGGDTGLLDEAGYAGPATDFGVPAGYEGEAWELASSTEPFPVMGELLTCDYSGAGNVTVWYEGFGGPSEALSFEVVPEPATIALLGLGGLALLRRRK